jgi:6-phosphogluconolactonase
MKLKQWGRIALLVGVSAVLGLGTLSCTDYTLGYLFATSGRYSQIYTYLVDANTGGFRLLNTEPNNYGGQGNPGSSGGQNPTRLVTAAAGTYLYVLNQGTANIELFTVGGDGVLFGVNGVNIDPTLAGQDPVDLKLSADGNYLYVLNQYQPTSVSGCESVPSGSCPGGSIAVYAIGNKGLLSPVPNTINSSGPTIYYFPVGSLPTQIYSGSGFLFTVDSAGGIGQPDIFVYSINSTGGGLNIPSSGNQRQACTGSNSTVGSINCVYPYAITGNSTYVYVSDYTQGLIYAYTIGTTGTLGVVNTSPFLLCTPTGGTTPNPPCPNIGPNYEAFDPSGKYLYVSSTAILPPSSVSPTPFSNIYAFFLASTGSSPGQITQVAASPFPSGADPQCIAISTGTEYLYTANFNDGTVTGSQVVTVSGALTPIRGGPASQTTSGQANCVVFSNRH